MRNRLFIALLALGIAFAFSTRSFAQDKKMDDKKMDDKMAMSKSEEKMGPMKSLSCDDKCGFMIRSHDEKEIMSAGMAHMKKHHSDMKMSKADMMKMIKTEGDDAKK
ncbi:MAG: DUF1059 domain-containing protein [Ignavibacteriae bacterium]|nr:DUF1059 domain-containing protein [Ignavibacteria bacterium]MBI3364118.1 DUF1059 domain-containing protein [Ignavibacteriota bacterium]